MKSRVSLNPATESIVLLDDQKQPIGTALKLDAHHENTPLHYAFSVYVFNEQGQLLVTQRALHKKVWPGVWTNSCCGHPAPNEPIKAAIVRRLEQELGCTVKDLKVVLPDYTYKTPPYNGIIEHEFCPVFFARINAGTLQANPDEVADFRWITWQEYTTETSKDSQDKWSWWCKDQASELEQNSSSLLDSYARTQ